ncbi:pyridine nucleotide-disulfide oxidoreductase [Xylanimonas oleitrophica]|uniref:Pyridine nucleotide-disulfide oxidoreductase n=1 Tax=Xylanimonas oleitrophica TaxID=2607479 RepID=A0A2W5X3K4_9MICO|nr:FAD-dependent oxidoreductase [Xylanimonas oleitrophica]PZR55536.1 pyridine nucleotide-disulfide oxidoreductase [Xylanimonas oleitrophica]
MPAAVDVVVVGAGQAGLSAGYHLLRRGFVPAVVPDGEAGPAGSSPAPARTFVVLDAEDGPGGAWRHRWRSLRMSTVNGIYDLPGVDKPPADPQAPSVDVLPAYFADYEHELGLGVVRPVRVRRVERADGGLLAVLARAGGEEATEVTEVTLRARALVNATGTWSKPFWPRYPGQETFRGRQLHTAGYVRAEDFAGRRVAVVGGGISALQLMEEISHVGETFWFTRREPVWHEGEFDARAGHDAVARVEERVRAGLPPLSVVSATGLVRAPYVRSLEERGLLVRRPMFTRIEPDGVVQADGTLLPVDVIFWNTGFRAALDHLRPLGLREPGGGVRMEGTQVAGEPRVHLVGYGPSSSTVGANRAGRDAVNAIVRFLDGVAAVAQGASAQAG